MERVFLFLAICVFIICFYLFYKKHKLNKMIQKLMEDYKQELEHSREFPKRNIYTKEEYKIWLNFFEDTLQKVQEQYSKIKEYKKGTVIQEIENINQYRNTCFEQIAKINAENTEKIFLEYEFERNKIKNKYFDAVYDHKYYLKDSIVKTLNKEIEPTMEKRKRLLEVIDEEPNNFDKALFTDDIYFINKDDVVRINNEFIEEELKRTYDFFSNIDGKSLDRQQRIAVITDEEANLVVAGAGSGKTLTIAAKTKYLVEEKGMDPKDILLITFTRNATNEMKERVQNKLGLEVNIKTFHKLGLDILKENPNMAEYDHKDSSQVISIDDIQKMAFENEDFKNKLFSYLTMYVQDNIGENDFKNKSEYYKAVDSFDTIEKTINKGIENVLKNLKINFIKQGNHWKEFNKETALDSLSKGDYYEILYKNIQEKIPEEMCIMTKEEFNAIREFIAKIEIKRSQNIFANTYEDVTKHVYSGTTVRSREEKAIANFLLLNGIKYEYESLYMGGKYRTMEGANASYRMYKPDFYLPKYDIYIEHFGVDKDMKAHQYEVSENKKYEESMKWKRGVHALNKTKLIETYSFQYSNGTLFTRLKEQLESYKVEFHPFSDEEINMYLAISFENDKAIDSFYNLFKTFLNLFKSNGFTEENLDEFRETAYSYSNYVQEKHLLFFDIFEILYKEYVKRMKEGNCIDFQDMINESASTVNAPDFIPSEHNLDYKYIIIDEFQDTSIARFRLVDAIRKANDNKTQIMVVGDDWQSIYRFAGSDIDLFIHFEKYFGISTKSFIEKTYRNSQNLLEVAGNFVMKNPTQIRKNLSSNKKNIEQPVQIHSFDYEKTETSLSMKTIGVVLSKVLQGIEHAECYKNKPGIEVLILGRNTKDIDILDDGVIFRLEKDEDTNEVFFKTKIVSDRIKISYKTVHGSKGLEADEVILLNVNDKKTGFPNKMEDDSVLRHVISEADSFLYAEERRLFYVALTRTRNHVHIFTDMHKRSMFIEELVDLPQVRVISHSENDFFDMKCPRCGGRLVKRMNRTSKSIFLGCENGSKGCRYTADFSLDYAFTRDTGMKDPHICPVCNASKLKKSSYDENEHYCPNYLRGKEKAHYKINKYDLNYKIAEFEKAKAEYELKQQMEAENTEPLIEKEYIM